MATALPIKGSGAAAQTDGTLDKVGEVWNKMIDLIIADFESLKRKSADGKEPTKFLTKDIKYDIM